MISLLLAVIYAAFISLGLPDALLGSAWPVMHAQMNVPLSYAGIVTFTIAMGTVVSALVSDRLTLKLGAGRVTALSVSLTALALLGFSISNRYWMLLLFAIPYGLGAGSVDAALNNYVALHYSNRHMSWLHCMWGVGASIGPSIMGWALTGNSANWPLGYRVVGVMQLILTAVILLSLPLWKGRPGIAQADENADDVRPMSISELVRLKGAKEIMITFFCYCALESTAGLWASSYLVFHHGLDKETAASCAALFYIGITAGRALNGFIAERFSDTVLTRAGFVIMGVGVLVLLFPLGMLAAQIGLIILGMGCAPTYPCIIHATPIRFGREKSQAFIGVQMASAYMGSTLMPPLFGLIANHISVGLYPVYMTAILLLMAVMHERVVRATEGSSTPVSRD
ncbi:MAG: MFS transporter [Clostridiales bacterium]|nr:MFS transporter [Clostridiales bacterium]